MAGRRFDFALIEQVAGRNEHELLSLIKELIAAQLVVEETSEQFAFRHALTRQAVYAGLLGRERRVLHRMIGEAGEHGADQIDGFGHERPAQYHRCDAL